MGLLDKLWDDVVAGPQPDTGLGRLRQKPKLPADVMAELPPDEAHRVTQSIAISKPTPLRVDSADGDYAGSTPSTPSGSTPTFSSSVGSPSIFDREKYLSRGVSVPSSPALGSPGGSTAKIPSQLGVERRVGQECYIFPRRAFWRNDDDDDNLEYKNM